MPSHTREEREKRRYGGFKENFERNFREQVGRTDFTDPARGASGLRNRARKSTIQPESTTLGRSNPPKAVSDRERAAVGPPPTTPEGFKPDLDEAERIARGDTGGDGAGFIETPDGGTASVSFRQRGPNDRRLETINENLRSGETPNVSTIPRESFVNPAYTGFVTPEQQAAREAPVRRELAREQRRAQEAEAEEFRRNLRDRQLHDDANLRLSGDMTLTELADAAQRRRSARETLRQRDTTEAETAASSAQSAAQRQAQFELEAFKQDNQNRRKLAELEGTRAGEKLTRQIERADRAFELNATRQIRNENGGIENLHSPELEMRARQLATASGNLDPDNMNEAEVTKITNMAEAMINIERASGASIENLSELQEIIGPVNETLLFDIIDPPELIFVNPETGGEIGRANLEDVVKGNSAIRRVLDKARDLNVKAGVFPNRRDSKWSVFGQEPDSDFGIESSDPEQRATAIRRQALAKQRREERGPSIETARRLVNRVGGTPVRFTEVIEEDRPTLRGSRQNFFN